MRRPPRSGESGVARSSRRKSRRPKSYTHAHCPSSSAVTLSITTGSTLPSDLRLGCGFQVLTSPVSIRMNTTVCSETATTPCAPTAAIRFSDAVSVGTAINPAWRSCRPATTSESGNASRDQANTPSRVTVTGSDHHRTATTRPAAQAITAAEAAKSHLVTLGKASLLMCVPGALTWQTPAYSPDRLRLPSHRYLSLRRCGR
jgi:hypothetical protein